LTDKPKAGLAKSDATLPHKSQPNLGVALLFHQKRAGFACTFLLTEPAKSRVYFLTLPKHQIRPQVLLHFTTRGVIKSGGNFVGAKNETLR
jgi:hypothetical protein